MELAAPKHRRTRCNTFRKTTKTLSPSFPKPELMKNMGVTRTGDVISNLS